MLFQNCIIHAMFHICLCVWVSVCVCFLELRRLYVNGKNCYTCSKLFWNIELLVILLISGRVHIISVHKVLVLFVFLFVPDLLSHSLLNTLWCVWYIWLNMEVSFYIVLFWECMCYIYINIELQMSLFYSVNTTWFWLQHIHPLHFIPFPQSMWVTFHSLLSQHRCKKHSRTCPNRNQRVSLGVYIQKWDFWVREHVNTLFHQVLLDCFLEWLYQFTFHWRSLFFILSTLHSIFYSLFYFAFHWILMDLSISSCIY